MKKYVIPILVILFSFTNIFLSNATDNANIGSISEDYGTMKFDTRLSDIWDNTIGNVNIARLSIWNKESGELIDKFTISNSSINDFQNERIRTFPNYLTKPEYIKQNKKLTDDQKDAFELENCYKYLNSVITISDFPQLIVSTGHGNTYDKIKDYFGNEEKLKNLFNKLSIRDRNIEDSNMVLLIEPCAIFSIIKNYEGSMTDIEQELILLTTTELGLLLYNKHPFLKSMVYDFHGGLEVDQFINYYHREICQALPFSCYKIDIEKLRSVKPISSKWKQTGGSWMCVKDEDYTEMITSLGCFEIYTKGVDVATISELQNNLIATPSELREANIEYYVNSYVITPVKVSTTMGFPRQSYTPGTDKDYDARDGCLTGKLAEITYTFDSDENLEIDTYTHKIAIPERSSAISWVKWKCPANPCQVVINITTNSEDAKVKYNSIIVDVVDPISGYYPPNPEATDRNDGFIAPSYATGSWNTGINNSLSWSTYTYNWHPYYVWGCSRTAYGGHLTEWGTTPNWDAHHICDAHECPENAEDHVCPTGKCHNVNEDWGWVEWTEIKHTFTLNTNNETLYRSANSPNTNNSDYSIKSGYGVEINIDTDCTYKVNGSRRNINENNNAVVPPQYMEVFLPEHNFENYKITSFNDLDSIGYDEDNSFNFPINPYSQFGQNCHFTPIWYPDGKYVVGAKISQCFCPAGMLTICNNNISININGNAYDDWHIAPEMN